MRYARLALSALVASLVVGGCAGGGGGGGSVVSPPPPPPPASPPPPPPPPPAAIPSSSSVEYLKNWGVGDSQGSKAITAWQNGATGQGITVAVIDTGIDATHPELAGRVSPNSTDIVSGRNQLFDSTDVHGSEVADVIAGNFNNSSTVGMAYNSTILAIRADDGTGSFFLTDLSNAINYAVAQHVDIINLSLGGSGNTLQFRNAISAATAAGIIVVASAGNAGIQGDGTPPGPAETEVEYPAFYTTNSAISHNLIVAAGGDNSDGTFNANSNPAGQAQNFYLVAPGWQIIVPDFGPLGAETGEICFVDQTCRTQGTSYSAPNISGALALLKSAFPGLTPAQLVQLILISADDMGAPGVDPVTGHGRLNLTTAFSSIGLVRAPLPGAAGELVENDTIGVVGAAFGDAFAQRDRWAAIGFDDFGRSFRMSLAPSWHSLSRATIADEGAPRLWRHVSTDRGEVQFAAADVAPPRAARMMIDPDETPFVRGEASVLPGLHLAFSSNAPIEVDRNPAKADGFLAFTGNAKGAAITSDLGGGFSLSLLTQRGAETNRLTLTDVERRADAAQLNFARGKFALGATLGQVKEDGAALGLAWGDRFGPRAQGRTHFGGLSANYVMTPSLQAGLEIESGVTDMNGASWFAPTAPIKSLGAAAALRWNVRPALLAELAPHTGGALTLTVSQPLRVESGALNVILPNSDEYGRMHLRFEPRQISIVPTGREIETRLGYELWSADQLSAQVDVNYTIDPGHDAEAPDEIGARVAVRKAF